MGHVGGGLVRSKVVGVWILPAFWDEVGEWKNARREVNEGEK